MSYSTRGRGRKAVAAVAAAGLSAGAAILAFAPTTGSASSHREAPFTAANPLADNTDTYAFVSPDKPDTVTLLANVIPFQNPSGGPNFFPFGSKGYRYNIKVDTNGDAKPDTTFRWTFADVDKRGATTFLYNNGPVNSFDDPTLLFKQTYTLESIDKAGKSTVLVKNGKTAPSNVGKASMPDYKALRDQAVTAIPSGGSAFAGQADDAFFLDLRVFDLLYGGDLSESGQASLSGYNVNTLAVQVPIANLTKGGDGSGIIGVWATTDQQTMSITPAGIKPAGDFVQVSRLGSPLVNEVVIPAALKDTFNSLTPDKDAGVAAAVARVTDPEVPKLIEKIYKIPAPAAPRNDLVAAFLTGIEGLNKPPKGQPSEMLRLNTKIAPAATEQRLGVLAKDTAGFPNGRRLADDVVDIELQALEGAITKGIVPQLAKGDGVDSNDVAFEKAFPYVALPHSGSGAGSRGLASEGASGGSDSSGSAAPAAGSDVTDQGASTNASSEQNEDGVGTGSVVLIGLVALAIGAVVGGLMSRRSSTA